MNLQALLEKRAKTVAQMRSLTDTASGEKRDLSETESTSFDGYSAEVRALDAQIQRAQVLAEAERSMPVDPSTPRRGNDGNFEDQCRSFSLCNAIASRLEPGSVDAGRENEISQELARRDGKEARGILVPHEIFQERRALLTTNTGQNLYPDRHRDDLFIDRLRESLRVGQLGATILSGLKGTQDIPKMTGSVSGYWVGEDEDVTASEAAFDSVKLEPKTVGAETEYSRRMIINASPDVEQLMRNDLSQVLATAIDFQAINGTGLANKPKGIRYALGTTKLPLDVGSTTPFADLLEFIAQMSTDNALAGNLAWLVNPKTYKFFRSAIREGTEMPIMTMPGQLLDYAIAQTNHVPSNFGSGNDESPVIFGNFSDLMIGYWSSVDILVNPYHADVYSKGGVKINAMQDVDIAVRHGESFAISEGLKV